MILASVMVVLGAAAECINVEPPAAVADLMESACIACHANGSDSVLDLESLVFDLSSKELFALWVQVLDMVESGEMPPLPEERPDAKVLHEAINTLSTLTNFQAF